MFGLFSRKKKEPVKINLQAIAELLERRHWDIELLPERNVVVVKGKYLNHHKTFDRLYLHFIGGKVQFKDGYGRAITHIPSEIEMRDLFPQLKNVLNVL